MNWDIFFSSSMLELSSFFFYFFPYLMNLALSSLPEVILYLIFAGDILSCIVIFPELSL